MLTNAFNDVIVDALMVYEAKKDLKRGSEDLQSLAFGTHSVTGLLAAFVGALFT